MEQSFELSQTVFESCATSAEAGVSIDQHACHTLRKHIAPYYVLSIFTNRA